MRRQEGKGERFRERERGEERGLETRRSKDMEVNGEGKRLCKYLEERGWGILNANIEGDEEVEWTAVYRRERELSHRLRNRGKRWGRV